MGLGTLVVVVNRIKGDQSLSEYLESGSFLDSSRTRDVYGETQKEQIQKAVQAYQRAGAPLAVSASEHRSIEQFLKKLEQTLRFQNLEEYRLLIDRTLLNQQVLVSGYLSADAKRDFLSDFHSWFDCQLEVSCTEIKLVRLEKDSTASTPQLQRFRAYTWVYNQDSFPARIVWLIAVSPRGVLLYDFEWVESGTSYSQLAAREYSAAYTSKRWENYTSLFTEDALSTSSYLREANNLEQRYPRSLYETVLLRFIELAVQDGEYETAIRIADMLSERAEIRPATGIEP